ncbi:hypothetical protein WICPIJ_005733 [Wickerhamomyces pijperi]|uniref:Thioredoxin domain-containing protein n=1 Tax=Wickerhamomyces pijperi TaxID=599730 RepID=A0A9P8Q5P6_WICPI|nr:hypothetical protein WICPIJ_005733 [Wickerhamomyces pijperi]
MIGIRNVLQISTRGFPAATVFRTIPTGLRFLSSSPNSFITEVKSLDSFEELIKSPKLTLTDFYATWCGPCNAISPILEKLAEKYQEEVQFLKVDVDESTEIAQEYQVSAMPTFVFFKDGTPIGKIVGANPQHIQQALEQYK